jgi:hypothetical protein
LPNALERWIESPRAHSSRRTIPGRGAGATIAISSKNEATWALERWIKSPNALERWSKSPERSIRLATGLEAEAALAAGGGARRHRAPAPHGPPTPPITTPSPDPAD